MEEVIAAGITQICHKLKQVVLQRQVWFLMLCSSLLSEPKENNC